MPDTLLILTDAPPVQAESIAALETGSGGEGGGVQVALCGEQAGQDRGSILPLPLCRYQVAKPLCIIQSSPCLSSS